MLEHLTLGKRIKTYHHTPPDSYGPVLVNGIAFLVILMPLVYGLYRSVYGYLNYGIIAARTWGRAWFLVSAIATGIFAIVLLFRQARSKSHASIYEKGIHIEKYRQQPVSFFWKDVQYIFEDAHEKTFLGRSFSGGNTAKIVLKTGIEVNLGRGLKNSQELVQRIKAKCSPRLRVEAFSDFQKNKDLAFGPLLITSKFMVYHGNRYPWSELTNIHAAAGKLVIELVNKQRISIPVRHIPNIEILIQLLMDGISY